MAGVFDRFDAFQQRHPVVGLPVAVYKKFDDDRAGNLAALLSYYAFFSIFPLLLALTTILGFVLAGHPALRHTVYSSALAQFPIVGQHEQIEPLTGNIPGLVIGLVLALWSGLGVAQTGQIAFNTIYGVPRADQPKFLPRLRRSIELVTVGGLGLLATTLLQGVVTATGTYGLHLGLGPVILGTLIGIVSNTLILLFLFHRLTVYVVSWQAMLPGALTAAVGWVVLQKVATGLVNSKIHGAQGTYGTFATVIGLLGWFYLLAQMTLYCAELNVVLDQRLWPRGLPTFTRIATTDADRRAYRTYPQREQQAHNVTIDVHIDKPDT